MIEDDNVSEVILRDDVADDRTLEAHHQSKAGLRNLKKAKDGHTILMPQPNDDPKNPLNWPMRKKIAVLLAVSLAAVLPDYGSATGAVTLIPQGLDWGLSPNYVNHSQAGNVFMLGAGGVFAVIMSQAYGRYTTAFWMVGLSVVWAILCAAAPNFNTFFAARILNGFFAGPTQATGLMFVRDMFFFHESARATNLWVAFFILSPYLGPLISAAVLSANPEDVKLWHWAFGQFAILSGVAFIGLIFFADETHYNRTVPMHLQPERGNRFARMTGIGRPKNDTFYSLKEAFLRTFSVLLKPTVLLTCVAYISTFAWVVGINTTLSLFLAPPVEAGGYGFGPGQIALFYFAPVIASIIGEVWGHFVNDFLANQYIKRHHGTFEPEVRLVAYLIGFPFLVAGLSSLGYVLENHWHWALAAVTWGLYVFGIMVASTGLTTYVLDTYPSAAGEVSAWLNMSRVLGGFIISYFQINWAESQGTIRSFGIQSGVIGAACVIVITLIIFGRKLRHIQGQVPFAQPSHLAHLSEKHEHEHAPAVASGRHQASGTDADSMEDEKREIQHVA